MPVVLRPVFGTSSFNLIGTCYVHGVMDGEAFTGSRVRTPAGPVKSTGASAKSIDEDGSLPEVEYTTII